MVQLHLYFKPVKALISFLMEREDRLKPDSQGRGAELATCNRYDGHHCCDTGQKTEEDKLVALLVGMHGQIHLSIEDGPKLVYLINSINPER